MASALAVNSVAPMFLVSTASGFAGVDLNARCAGSVECDDVSPCRDGGGVSAAYLTPPYPHAATCLTPLAIFLASVPVRYATAVNTLSAGAFSLVPPGSYVTSALDTALTALFSSTTLVVRPGAVPATAASYVVPWLLSHALTLASSASLTVHAPQACVRPHPRPRAAAPRPHFRSFSCA